MARALGPASPGWPSQADIDNVVEVCGGHTHTIYKPGIEDLVPETVELVNGPGCPVCVVPNRAGR